MDELDLRLDDPEEYEGRSVSFGGGNYIVGRWVGEGGERIVHELRNSRSGLTLYLIGVVRDQQRALEIAEKSADRLSLIGRMGLPVLQCPMIVEAHGGVFEVQEAASPERGPTAELAGRARHALDLGRLQEAEELCNRALEIRPEHTEILHLLACLAEVSGEHFQAMQFQMRVLEIEPNLPAYVCWYLERLASQGLLQNFLVWFDHLKQRWPRLRRADDLAIEVLLALGRPDDAARLLPPTPASDVGTLLSGSLNPPLTESEVIETRGTNELAEYANSSTEPVVEEQTPRVTDPEVEQELREAAQEREQRLREAEQEIREDPAQMSALEGLAVERACELDDLVHSAARFGATQVSQRGLRARVEQEVQAYVASAVELDSARDALMAERDDEVLSALRRAYAHYPKARAVALNLGFSLLRRGDWRDAYDVLASVYNRLSEEAQLQCLGSMAFALTRLFEDEKAASMLEHVADRLAVHADGEPVSYWDLPAWVRWFEPDRLITERSSEPANIVTELISRVETPSVQLRRLGELYSRGP